MGPLRSTTGLPFGFTHINHNLPGLCCYPTVCHEIRNTPKRMICMKLRTLKDEKSSHGPRELVVLSGDLGSSWLVRTLLIIDFF